MKKTSLFILIPLFHAKGLAAVPGYVLKSCDRARVENIIRGETCFSQNKRKEISKDSVINIDAGRQLFVDDYLISRTNLQRRRHYPSFYRENPVLIGNKKWEEAAPGVVYAAPFSDGIWYDEKDKKYKMWYLTGASGFRRRARHSGFCTAYACSTDGKHWTKPDLAIFGQTNIIDTCDRDAATMWLDKEEKNPMKRYKFFMVQKRPKDSEWQFVLKYSADGLHWGKGVAQSGDIYDRSTAFYNPFRHKWALSLRFPSKQSYRSRAYMENKNPETLVSLAHKTNPAIPDKYIRPWLSPDKNYPSNPDEKGINPGIYNFDAMPYESIMLGFYTIWQGPENKVCAARGIPKRNQVYIAYSRDGFHFTHPENTAFIGVGKGKNAWNRGNVQSVNGMPLIVGDSLYFYVSGRSGSPKHWDAGMGTGLAMLRRDGFASMHAGKKEASLTTKKLRFSGKHMFVNASLLPEGSLWVEVLDKLGNPLPPFSGKNSLLIKGKNSTKLPIKWRKKQDLSSLEGKTVRFRFHLSDGDLYSFWVSPWKSGESRGYTAGGGPGLSSSGRDFPVEAVR